MGARCEGGSTSAMEPSCPGEGGGEAGREMSGKAAPEHHVPAFQVPWLETEGHGANSCQGLGGRGAGRGAVASEVGSL